MLEFAAFCSHRSHIDDRVRVSINQVNLQFEIPPAKTIINAVITKTLFKLEYLT